VGKLSNPRFLIIVDSWGNTSRARPLLPSTCSKPIGQFHADSFTTVYPQSRYRIRNCTRYASEDAWSLPGASIYQSHYSYTEGRLGKEATDLLVDLVREQGIDRGLYGELRQIRLYVFEGISMGADRFGVLVQEG
jgi:hypothetical protein